MPYLDITAIKREISLKMVLDHIGWKPRTIKDGEQRGVCPLHTPANPRSRSFAVRDDGWFCHTCKDGGDQFRFWCLLYKVSFMAAVRQMCRAFCVPEYELPRHEWKAIEGNGEEER